MTIASHIPNAPGHSADNDAGGTVSALPALSILSFEGQDAIAFLQGQITNDIADADSSTARLAGYCTAQGRLLGTMVAYQPLPSADASIKVLAIVRQDIASALMKRLGMFVLRAKVKISQPDLRAYGISCHRSGFAKLQADLNLELPVSSYTVAHNRYGSWICAPRSRKEVLRWWLIRNPEQILDLPINAEQLCTVDEDTWNSQDLAAGLPWIQISTQDLFIPQTLNLDLINGVSFTKGCYPGQEIVARSHYRGTLKRRMAFGLVDLPSSDRLPITIQPGDDIIDTRDGNQACGRIINCVMTAEQAQLLFEAPFSAMANQGLALASYPESVIRQIDLPYSIMPA